MCFLDKDNLMNVNQLRDRDAGVLEWVTYVWTVVFLCLILYVCCLLVDWLSACCWDLAHQICLEISDVEKVIREGSLIYLCTVPNTFVHGNKLTMYSASINN